MLYPIQSHAIEAVADTVADDEPVFMLNMLRFDGDDGREAYFSDYVGAFRALAADMGIGGIEPVWNASVTAMVAGPESKIWDAMLVVRYPSLAAFRTIVESEDYRRRVAPHRERALLDWRLIAHRPVDG